MNRLRGSSHGRIDDKGRLKIPATFRSHIEERYGRDLFITSRDGATILVYPLPVWEELEMRLSTVSSQDPDREQFETWTSYFGGQTDVDNQGRALVPQVLRERFGHEGEVVVMGKGDHLVVATKEQMQRFLDSAPLTRDVLVSLSSKGV
jgi:MraZ protein